MIRLAETRDGTRVRALIEQLEGFGIDEAAFFDVFRANIQSKDVYYIVDEENGTITGFISLHIQRLLHHAANIAEIQELIVDAPNRGRGIGARLYRKAAEIAKSENCPQIEVCCNVERENSHRFYLSMGMTRNHYKFCDVINYE